MVRTKIKSSDKKYIIHVMFDISSAVEIAIRSNGWG